MNTGSPNLDALLLKLTNKKEREILEQYAGAMGVLPFASCMHLSAS